MANPEHVEIFRQGVEVWNKWRDNISIQTPDLSGVNFMKVNFNNANFSGANLAETVFHGATLYCADLSGADLSGAFLSNTFLHAANLHGANLIRANLHGANLYDADLSGADLRNADLTGANLSNAFFSAANLSGANLTRANLNGANFSGALLIDANLSNSAIVEVNLSSTTLVKTNFTGTTISDTKIYGVSAWDLNLESIKEQKNLRVTPDDQPAVYVDNLEVAQFVYLLLHNEKIRGVIDTIGEKGVLILGRFAPERKAVLDAIRDKLRELGFVPMMFDFDPTDKRDFTETIRILAGMSRFIIADISEPKCIPLELQAIVPDYAIPLVPIFHVQQGKKAEEPFAMIRDLQKYKWVFEVLEYESPEILLDSFEEEVVNPAKDMSDSLLPQKAEGIRKRRLGEGK